MFWKKYPQVLSWDTKRRSPADKIRFRLHFYNVYVWFGGLVTLVTDRKILRIKQSLWQKHQKSKLTAGKDQGSGSWEEQKWIRHLLNVYFVGLWTLPTSTWWQKVSSTPTATDYWYHILSQRWMRNKTCNFPLSYNKY